MTIPLNTFGEVADFTYPVNQFYDGTRSEDACGPYCSGYIKYMGYPGQGAKGHTNDIDAWAYLMYTRYIGPDTKANHNGTDIAQLYRMLADGQDMALPYTFVQFPLTIAAILYSIGLGRPVVVAAAETGMHDMDNGNAVDYAWTPTGNHIVVITGVRPRDGALAVRDPANIGATGQRGSGDAATHTGPVFYNPATFGPLVSVTSIIPPWQCNGPVTHPQLHAACATLAPFAQAVLDALAAS